MYEVPPNSIMEIRLTSNFTGQTVINTFHYASSVTYDDGADILQQACDAFEDAIWTPMSPLICTAVTNVTAFAQWVAPIRYRSDFKIMTPAAGTAADDPTPTGVSVVLRRFAEKAGRKYQGRIYVYGSPIGNVVNSTLTDAAYNSFRTNVLPPFIATLTLADTSELTPVLYDGVAYNEDQIVLGGQVDRIIRYQRRREIGVGI